VRVVVILLGGVELGAIEGRDDSSFLLRGDGVRQRAGGGVAGIGGFGALNHGEDRIGLRCNGGKPGDGRSGNAGHDGATGCLIAHGIGSRCL